MVGTRGRNEGGRCDGHEFLFLFFYSLLHFFVSSQAYISYIHLYIIYHRSANTSDLRVKTVKTFCPPGGHALLRDAGPTRSREEGEEEVKEECR